MDAMQSNDIPSAFFSPTFAKDGSFQVDKPVGSMSISPCGRDVVLASRQGLHIIDLDSPWSPPRNLPHLTPWEVADVQWSPFPSRDYWVVSTSNQKALVWNLAMTSPKASIEHILHAHNRAITDINFSAHHPDLLATCAVDGFVHCWDLRHTTRPAISFCDWFAGATQVKWNRQDGHIIASSHDKILRIWDDRKGAYPLRSIVAHDTKIYGIDWNRLRRHGILTCSLDRTIKFWDFSQEDDEPERIIDTGFPVWRARHTPFGWGLLAMPQRGDNDVYLFDRRFRGKEKDDDHVKPVKRFEGHEGQVKEFLWRPRGSIENGIDNREFQLVTWGNDKTLRLHRLEDEDLVDVGYQRGAEVHSRLQFTRQNAQYKTFREDPSKSVGSNKKISSTGNKPFLDTDSGMEMYRVTVGTSIPSLSNGDGGWMGGSFVSSRLGTHSRAGARKDLDPIAWMKGVKIGKKEAVLDQVTASNPLQTSTDFRADGSHEEFESLGEEITHVGSKFSRVEFSHIDVHNRRVNFSLHGPWGPKHLTTYLECRLDFPKEYPARAAPILHVERTTSIDGTTASKLQADVKRIGEAFRSCQRSSLEALIHFLQGEQTAEEILAWTKDDPEASDFTEGDASSSSDEEDDIEFPGTQASDFGLTGSGVLSASNANTNVPLPRTCGATWTTGGRLVCFFLPAEDKSIASLTGSLGLEGLLNRKRRIFEGFGKFHKPLGKTKSKSSSVGTLDSEETDSDYDSDSSDYSSSSSSISSKGNSSKSQYYGPQPAFRTDIVSFARPEMTLDEAQRSVASGSMATRGHDNPKGMVSIHDLEAELPSKEILAKNYLVTGRDPCAHNARIALAHGHQDLADVWTLLDMLLKEEVPVQAISLGADARQFIDVHVLHPLNRHDNEANFSSTRTTKSMSAPVKWGQHALGRGHLIGALFGHFTQIADIQMVAMMSCVLSSLANDQTPAPVDADEQPSHVRSPISHSGTVLSPSGATPSRTDYFPSIEVAFSVLQAENQVHTPFGQTKSQAESISMASSFGGPNSDPLAPLSAGLTPPLSFHSTRRSFDRPDSGSQPLASSPDRVRWAQRSASNITNLATSFPRPFSSFSASASSSPPYTSIRKRPSPIGSLGILQAQGSIWSSGDPLNKSIGTLDDPRSATRAIEPKLNCRQKLSQVGKVSVSTRLRNQDQFVNDGYCDAPFLDEAEQLRYQIFRQQYANMLSNWGLDFKRTEILKFNILSTEATPVSHKGNNFAIGRKISSSTLQQPGLKQLYLVSTCNGCAAPIGLTSPGAQTRCEICHARQTSQVCALCHELVRTRSLPCLQCGHILHSQCRRIVAATVEVNEIGCVTGCGCICEDYVETEMLLSTPQAAVPASSTPSTIKEEEEYDDDDDYDDENRDSDDEDDENKPFTWEDIVYESLARNLGTKVMSVPRGGQRNRHHKV